MSDRTSPRVRSPRRAELHDKIARARAILRLQIPDGDLAAIVDRAMSGLLRELERADSRLPAQRKTTCDAGLPP